MYEYVSSIEYPFNLSECYNQIAGAAFRFEEAGRLGIWIYLKAGVLSFRCYEFEPMAKFFVAHYRCRRITRGFSNSDWDRLGRRLARAYLSNK